MAQLKDLLRPDVTNSNDLDNFVSDSLCAVFSFHLKTSIIRARTILQKYGKGYIYNKRGFAMSDSLRMRDMMVKQFGFIVIIDERGNMFTQDRYELREIKLKKEKNIEAHQIARENKLEKEEKRAYMEQRNRRNMFCDGQGVVSPKRGGKANSHSDIGKYVSHGRSKSVSNWYSTPQYRFF